ncbi:N-acetylmuramoyl-L-alanine amidase [Pectinatus haikarae]|uniref:N-acetylmuramoyl-L-alanine amidase n=1 Tax=Pectinatus haikarae TaxID=349096 RepID=A0ABT9Y5K9_9FIRM|nr:N-acetylmuramoyl-L-alanine amidase [Pectinatus haikarae]MDQ0203117.1 N-acetylmuramoyl-L-alanine amidase [Pectinatus haikarae]
MPRILSFFLINIFLFSFFLSLPQTARAGNFTAAASSLAKITDIRISSANGKVRLVADADKEIDYESFGLSSPDRIVIDLKGAWITPSVKKEFTVANKNIRNIRVAQFSHDTVRIVINTSLKRDSYDVFSLSAGSVPYRVVMDFGRLKEHSQTSSAKTASSASTSVIPSNTTADIFTSPGIKGKKIAIDPGHGGNDSGAVGYNGAKEKDSTLRIGLKLKKMLEDAGATVIMTRTTDTSVAAPTASDVAELQARCDIANKAGADIFISIHNDSFTDTSANGTSTYYYENGSGLSERLAEYLRRGIIDNLNTPDRGTKTANFYVIKHTDMPAVLIEAAFISNPTEQALLTSDSGTDKFAAGIYNGINKFFSSAGS